jgi:hypothetical protein
MYTTSIDFFNGVTELALKARKIFIAVLVVAAILVCIPIACAEVTCGLDTCSRGVWPGDNVHNIHWVMGFLANQAKKQLAFCNDNKGINDFFNGVTELALKARKIFIAVLVCMAGRQCTQHPLGHGLPCEPTGSALSLSAIGGSLAMRLGCTPI